LNFLPWQRLLVVTHGFRRPTPVLDLEEAPAQSATA
jgi:hypothetical protein